jgi:hypothetical protein
LYQFNVAYPFDQVRSLRATFGLRKDLGDTKPADQFSLKVSDTSAQYLVGHIEYVPYDNTINPAQNIWNGLRCKVYFDMGFGQTLFKCFSNRQRRLSRWQDTGAASHDQ